MVGQPHAGLRPAVELLLGERPLQRADARPELVGQRGAEPAQFSRVALCQAVGDTHPGEPTPSNAGVAEALPMLVDANRATPAGAA